EEKLARGGVTFVINQAIQSVTNVKQRKGANLGRGAITFVILEGHEMHANRDLQLRGRRHVTIVTLQP
uniref:hypothetical protein n=1 Tax=Vibrio vulnificus TaxID=672 RepID=UPI0019D4E096